MDFKQLQAFVSVAEQGSFTRAAQQLNVAQPALSRLVRALELELRQTLLERNGRGARPTVAGKRLLDHARGILHQLDRAQEDMAQLRGGQTGSIALGLPPSVARVLTVPLTRAFRAELPAVHLTIREDLSMALQDGLQQGRLDVALLYHPPQSEELIATALLQEALVQVEARPSGLIEDPPPPPLRLADLAHLPLIIPSRPNAIRMKVESELMALALAPQIAMEIDGVAAILDLVADGSGHAVLTHNAVTKSIRPSAYRVRPLFGADGEPVTITLWMAVSQSRISTHTQQVSMSLIRDQVQAHLAASA